jgi:hypothetical protein
MKKGEGRGGEGRKKRKIEARAETDSLRQAINHKADLTTLQPRVEPAMLSGKVSTYTGRTLIKISTSSMLRYISIMLSRKTARVACLKVRNYIWDSRSGVPIF